MVKRRSKIRKPLIRKKRRKRKKIFTKKKIKAFFGKFPPHLWNAFLLCVIWGGVFVAGLVALYAYDLPDISSVAKPQRRPAITLLSSDGTVFKRYGDIAGRYVKKDQVPQNLINAIISIEDRRFYSHFGIDILGLMRAMYNNIKAGRVVQGGSTLTQQLAKNLFLTPKRTTKRKVQEMLLAFWLEHTYSKDQIITAYLNRVYLGSGAFGVDAASDVYFGKPVSALNLRECAILAGLLRAPSRYSPSNDPARSMRRANVVLRAMVDAGYITEVQKQEAILTTPPLRKPGAGGDGHYFSDWIVEQVGSMLENTPQDIVVLTTLNINLQKMAERKLDAILDKYGDKRDVHQASLVSMDYDGAVRVMVGGRDYKASQFNRVTQARRQVGSAFKPVIYLSALRKGMKRDDVFDDAPIKMKHWSPKNYNNKYLGKVTADLALEKSINTIAVKVMQKAGVATVIDTARALGVTSKLNHDLSLALGTNLMTPMELTGVYAAFATGGRAVTPYGIKEIRNSKGKILYKREAVILPVTVDQNAVSTLVDMLQNVVKFGTGRRANIGRPVAGKTGTSSDYKDAWFMGFSGHYVTGVWMGNDDNKPMKRVTGGTLPAMLWHDYMASAESIYKPRDLLQGVIINNNRFLNDEPKKKDMLGDLIKSVTGGN